MPQSLHDIKIDPRNAEILISINGTLYPRDKAMVSVFDSGFILGDGVWEGLRLVNGGVPFLRAHMERLYEGAKAIFMDVGIAPEELVKRLFDCLDANRMHDGVHIRLMVTRGVKATPYQDPRVTISPATIVIIPEYKTPSPEKFEKRHEPVHGERAARRIPTCRTRSSTPIPSSTASPPASRPSTPAPTRRSCSIPRALSPPATPPTSSSSGAARCGRPRGNTASRASPAGNMIRLCRDNGIPVFEKQFSLYDVYGADEAFVTGTFAGLMPVREIDGRPV